MIYLDHAATTKIHPEVIKTITDTMTHIWGNPSSIYKKGLEAKQVLDHSRETISQAMNCRPDEILFTSGACESNSFAIQGYINQHKNSVLITTPIEHKSIQALCNDNPYDIRYVNVDSKGRVDLGHLEQLCSRIYRDGNPVFVSIQSANSEIGTIQDVRAISEIVHRYHGVFHTDSTQLFPHQKLDVTKFGMDMLSMSGQKINAPKGIGLLYSRNGIKLKPLIYGNQMEARRGGTENIPYIAGLSKAIELLHYDNSYVRSLRDYFINRLHHSGLDFLINGDFRHRLPNHISISFQGIEAEALLLMLDMNQICVSGGSACDSRHVQVSPVLKAIGVPEAYIHGTIRITLSNDNTFDEIDYACEKIAESCSFLRKGGI